MAYKSGDTVIKYKVGDRVRIKSRNWYDRNKEDVNGTVQCGERIFDSYMGTFCGCVLTISGTSFYGYELKEDLQCRTWTDEMIEGLVKEGTIDLTSVVMETIEEKTIQNTLSYGYNLPDGYQFKDENGNVINATKIVLEKKEPKYPTTYEECCKILGIYAHFIHHTPTNAWYKHEILSKFDKLLICRDAYWKIAGEEMGLGRPWKPDWNSVEDKYVIYSVSNNLWLQTAQTRHCLLAFPTEEMRDAFKESGEIGRLIRDCKEFL